MATKNSLLANEKFMLATWVKENETANKGKSYSDIAELASKALEIKVTGCNVELGYAMS